MRKMVKRLFVAALVVLLLSSGTLAYLYFFHGYHGKDLAVMDPDHKIQDDTDGDGIPNLKDPDADGDGISNAQDIAQMGNQLAGTLYDPLKGGYENIGGKLGFIVCIDVPRIAYAHAGIYLQDLLTRDFKAHPEHYDTQNGMNTPQTPYFFRRVRNVYDYAEGNGLLIKKSAAPKVGDIVFYGRYHATLVVGVHKDGTYDEVEAHPKLIFVQKHVHKKWKPHDVARFF
ncbi:DUF1287 domain-containing protein [Caenibacillus caldisaponilyticus]|uniref:DUF1287 domain-containing protein n=1 Tax=Caenibacillus caldisaponilyticus TaxID=1674942 RepID=UPI00098853CD|nr:DUF1287 domain-containing protein [Caenibacillus caldisaponilyticus]